MMEEGKGLMDGETAERKVLCIGDGKLTNIEGMK